MSDEGNYGKIIYSLITNSEEFVEILTGGVTLGTYVFPDTKEKVLVKLPFADTDEIISIGNLCFKNFYNYIYSRFPNLRIALITGNYIADYINGNRYCVLKELFRCAMEKECVLNVLYEFLRPTRIVSSINVKYKHTAEVLDEACKYFQKVILYNINDLFYQEGWHLKIVDDQCKIVKISDEYAPITPHLDKEQTSKDFSRNTINECMERGDYSSVVCKSKRLVENYLKETIEKKGETPNQQSSKVQQLFELYTLHEVPEAKECYESTVKAMVELCRQTRNNSVHGGNTKQLKWEINKPQARFVSNVALSLTEFFLELQSSDNPKSNDDKASEGNADDILGEENTQKRPSTPTC